MFNNIKVLVIGLVIIIVLGAGYFFLGLSSYWQKELSEQQKNESTSYNEQSKEQNQPAEEQPLLLGSVLMPSKPENALLLLEFTEVDWAMSETEAATSMTAFDLLEKGVKDLNLDLKTKDYGEMGLLVEKIGDKTNGDDGKYWLYYINGKMAEKSVSKQEIKAGDVVEFKFEKSSF